MAEVDALTHIHAIPDIEVSGFKNFVISEVASTSTPVLITSPHDGPLAGWNMRSLRRRQGGIGRDMDAMRIVDEIVGDDNRFNLVQALLGRDICDYNRFEGDGAFNDPIAALSHHTYHAFIEWHLSRLIAAFGVRRALLVDMHGFYKSPAYAPPEGYDIILGTYYRQTVPHGDLDWMLAEFLLARGYSVFVPETRTQIEGKQDYLPGKRTVRYYAEQFGMNAIQIEVARKWRHPDNDADRDRCDSDRSRLAHDLRAFLEMV